MPGKTGSCENSKEKFRMLRALLPDTPKPFEFQLKYKFCSLFTVFSAFPVFAPSGVGKWPSGVGKSYAGVGIGMGGWGEAKNYQNA